MNKSSRTDANQMLLPLEEFLAGEAARRAPDREPRQVGDCLPTSVRDVIDRLGRPSEGGGGRKADPTRDGEVTPRIETGGKRPLPEGRAVALAETVIDQMDGTTVKNDCKFLPRTILDRRSITSGLVAMVYVVERMPSEDHDHASSETWIDF